jgi:hypothetical protein
VTGQHIGRLRRVSQRFGAMREGYKGLFWSHFFAASDWNDAEMWLEGAVQNRWSVSQMRNQRWETLGRVGDPPQQAEEVAAETDEDAPAERDPHTLQGSYDEVPGPRHDGPDFGDEDSPSHTRTSGEEYASNDSPPEKVELIRPFADLPELPEDLAEAFDGLKLVLLRHKTDGWQSISCEATLAWLDALKSLATAPTSEEAAPF